MSNKGGIYTDTDCTEYYFDEILSVWECQTSKSIEPGGYMHYFCTSLIMLYKSSSGATKGITFTCNTNQQTTYSVDGVKINHDTPCVIKDNFSYSAFCVLKDDGSMNGLLSYRYINRNLLGSCATSGFTYDTCYNVNTKSSSLTCA